MTSSPTILLLGLPPGHQEITYKISETDVVVRSGGSAPAETQAIIKSQLDALPKQLRDVGVDATFLIVTPEDADSGFTKVRDALGSKSYDGVVIGNGVRTNMALTGWMERIIDVIHSCAPDAKMMFNTMPATSVDAVRRWFPIRSP